MKKKLKFYSFVLILIMFFVCLFSTEVQAKSKVCLNKNTVSIYKGKTYTLKVSGTKASVKWSTSNKNVVTVNNKGVLKGIKPGTATITAKVSGKSYNCKVTVKKPTINTTNVSLAPGKSYNLKLTGASIKTIKSSNTEVAAVSSTGKITAKKDGKVTITIKDSVSYAYKVSVVVKHTHIYSQYIITKNPTCLSNGIKTATCTVKGCSVSKTEIIPKLNHIWKEATCTEAKTCTRCGATEGSAKGHNLQWVTTKEAAVGVAGLKEHKCITCGYVDGTETIPALADVGQETPWVYADSTHRTKTMYDGTVICEELVTCGYYSVWGYYDDGAASAMNDAVNYMLVNVNGWNPFNVSSAYYDNARRNAVAYAIKGGSDKAYHFNRGGLPDINNDRQYITLSDGNNQDNYIGCFVRDDYQGNGDSTYGEYWHSHFGTYYASGSF